MMLQTVISQGNLQDVSFDEQPTTVWGGADTGDYPTLAGVSKVDIFTPTTTEVDTYNHAPIIIEYFGDGVLHVLWNSSPLNETSATHTYYSKSTDFGVTWSAKTELFEYQDDETKDYLTETLRQFQPSGFIVINGDLYAVADVNDFFYNGGGGAQIRTGVGVLARQVNSNGTFGTVYWIENVDGTLTPPTEIPTYPTYTFNTSLRNSIREEINKNPDKTFAWYQSVPETDEYDTQITFGSNLLYEPSVCELPSGQWLKLWRENKAQPVFKVAQTSNYGHGWGSLYVTDIPDSPSKTIHFRFNQEVCLVGNNGNAVRDSLYLGISIDGLNYSSDNLYNIDKDTAGQQFSGFGKGGGPQYPSAIKLSNGKIACVYSVRKEIIRVSIFDKPTLI